MDKLTAKGPVLPPEQTIPLSQLQGIGYRMARAWLQYHDAYYIMLGDVRTKVVADQPVREVRP
jgi:hypothetical protein